MINIIYEAHATTFDNEARLSSGHYDVALSPLGEKQAQELGERYKSEHFDAIFCSDLQRSYKTAEIAFEGRKFKIIKDPRLRECDYGDMTRYPSDEIEPKRIEYLEKSYPNGESYKQAVERVKVFLKELLENYNGKRVMIIGHRVPLYSLGHFAKKLPLKDVIVAPWKWQPGWVYYLEKID